jgi:hypothetical protein
VSVSTYVLKWPHNSHHCHLPQIKSPHPPSSITASNWTLHFWQQIPPTFFINSALWQFKKHKSHLLTVAGEMFLTRIAPLLLYERAYFDHWLLFDCKRCSLLRISSRFCSEGGTNAVFCISITFFPRLMLRRHSHLAYLFLRHCSMLTFLSCPEPITTRIVLTHSLNDVFRLRKTPLGATYTNCRTQSKYNIHESVHRNNIII